MRRLMTVLAAAVVLPLAACGDRDPTEATGAVSGTYSLRTINGTALPFTIEQEGDDLAEVTRGSITFHSGSTFTDSLTVRVTIDGETAVDEDVATGTYQQTGSAVVLTPSVGQPYAVSLAGNQLIQTFGQFALVYRK